jgi:hypothetical protein
MGQKLVKTLLVRHKNADQPARCQPDSQSSNVDGGEKNAAAQIAEGDEEVVV